MMFLPNMSKIGNLESIKRAFSNKDYEEFQQLLENQEPPFRYFEGDYLDASDFESYPDFIIGNRNRGFVQSDVLDRKRAYFFVAFNCFKENDRLVFKSYWIVNSNDSLEILLESDYGGFKFSPIELPELISRFKGKENGIALNYLH